MSAAAQILYIEDNVKDYELFSGMLEESSQGTMRCSGTPSLGAALARLKTDPFSAVLLDLNLLDISGARAVRILHESHPQLPIIVLTGVQEETQERDAFASGAQEYLVKGQHSAEQLKHSVTQSIRCKKMEAEFFHRSHYDALTRLPNALLLDEHVRHTFHRARRCNERPALLLVEIQNYATLLRTFGPERSAGMLASFSLAMKHFLRESDVRARWDEHCFAVLLENMKHPQHCEQLAQRLSVMMRQPVTLSGGKVQIETAIGMALMGSSISHPGELVIAAKGALEEARKHYSGIYVYAADDNSAAV